MLFAESNWLIPIPNELAHSKARDLMFHTHGGSLQLTTLEIRDQPTTNNEISQHFYLGRRIYPPSHRKLHRAQALKTLTDRFVLKFGFVSQNLSGN